MVALGSKLRPVTIGWHSPSDEAPPCYAWRVPPFYLRSTSVCQTEVLRRYHGGTTEVSYRRAPDTGDGGSARGSASEGKLTSGNVTDRREASQGRDGGAVQCLVLQAVTVATGFLAARALN